MDDKTTGKRIKKARDKKAWTQEHLADAARVSVRTVQRAEEGVMSAETLTALAGALGESVDDLTKTEATYPRITPILYYDNVKTLDWLVEVLGFEIRMKYTGAGEKIMHAELTHGDCVIMCGSPDHDADWATPSGLNGKMTQSIYLSVDDVDAHHAHAVTCGANVLSEPEEGYGQKRYRVLDPEGHLWQVATQL